MVKLNFLTVLVSLCTILSMVIVGIKMFAEMKDFAMYSPVTISKPSHSDTGATTLILDSSIAQGETHTLSRVSQFQIIPAKGDLISKESLKFWIKLGFSIIFCAAALFIILSGRYPDDTKKWAFSVLTLISGVWIGSL